MDELDEIVPHILNNDCIFFIGAGLSNLAGCYDWDAVVKRLIEHEIIKQKKIKYEDLRYRRFSNEELIYFCQQELCNNGKENDFWGIARLAIIKDPVKFRESYLPLAEQIKKIEPFPTIITTNIDNCLEEAGIINLNRIFYEPNDININNLDRNTRSIFHIHGYVERFKESLLTKHMYLVRYREDWFQTFLTHIFSNYSILFLGYSLRDSEIKNILMQTGNNKKHFALVPVEDEFSSSDISIFLNLYRIKIITYGRRDEFPTLLIDWINRNFAKTKLEE